MVAILFVCLGNICRSPAAEAMLVHLNRARPDPIDLHVESCGLGAWHVGHLPSEQMRAAAALRGIALSGRAKLFLPDYLYSFDYILAADAALLQELLQCAVSLEQRAKMHLFTEYSRLFHRQDIPDPYIQKGAAFDIVLDMLEECCRALLEQLPGKP